MRLALLRWGLVLACAVAWSGEAPARSAGQAAQAAVSPGDCDRLAAAPDDPDKTEDGVPFEALKAEDAVRACRAAVADDPDSARFAFQLARALHRNGSHQEALGLYRRAADKGSPAAMHGLGRLHAKGLGVNRDPDAAVTWFRKAADRGHTGAMLDLAMAHLNGIGVSRDRDRALHWWHTAADKGSGAAMAILGVTYNWGLGVDRDAAKAAEYMFGALARGDKSARREMARNVTAWGRPFRTLLQLRLAMADVYSGTIDGTFGADTHRAIKALGNR